MALPTTADLTRAAETHLERAIVRDYCASALFSPGSRAEPLCLPRRGGIRITEADMATSVPPGSRLSPVTSLDDPRVRVNMWGGVDIGSPHQELTTTERAANGMKSWRALARRVLREAERSPLVVERATVLRACQRLLASDRDYLHALADPDHPTGAQLARRVGVPERTYMRRQAEALDALVEAVYALVERGGPKAPAGASGDLGAAA